MSRAWVLGAVMACAVGTETSAATAASSASFGFSWWAFGDEDLIAASGTDGLFVSSRVTGLDERETDRDAGTFTMTNLSADPVSLGFTFSGSSNGGVIADAKGPVGVTFADTQSSVTITSGFGTFSFGGDAAGQRKCIQPSLVYDGPLCPRLEEQFYDVDHGTNAYFTLAGGSSLHFGLTGYSASTVRTLAIVPLPASVSLLGLGLGGLVALRRAKR